MTKSEIDKKITWIKWVLMKRLDPWQSRLRPATRGQVKTFWHIVCVKIPSVYLSNYWILTPVAGCIVCILALLENQLAVAHQIVSVILFLFFSFRFEWKCTCLPLLSLYEIKQLTPEYGCWSNVRVRLILLEQTDATLGVACQPQPSGWGQLVPLTSVGAGNHIILTQSLQSRPW